MDYIGLIEKIMSLLGIYFLVYKSIKINFLKFYLNGKEVKINKDEIENTFRILCLAKMSEIYGGKRVEYSLEWKKINFI